MKVFVVDASVAIKWFPPFDTEPFAAEARTLLDSWSRSEIEIMVPDLFWAEVGNIIWKSVRVGRCSLPQAQELLETMPLMNLQAVSSGMLVESAFHIANTHGRAIYDCLYVALSRQSGAAMVSADERLVNALAAHYAIKWLGAV
jgi:predicted nucleic acid-binding protein